MFAVTIFAKTRKNAAIKNLLGEPGVSMPKGVFSWLPQSGVQSG
jgi:hypothetical protein